MMKATWMAIALSPIFFATSTQAATFTLYDGSRNTALRSQGWEAVVPPGVSQTVSGGTTTLNTTLSNSLQAGYFRSAPQSLNRTTGYTLGFEVQLLSEAHSSPHRAGFSVIALSSDRRGIELGFWGDRIWAQNDGVTKPPRFTQAEGTPYATSSIVRYDLSILGNNYRLFANRQPILTGNLRNYSPEGFPYTTPNFLFFGDNTTSARASVRIRRIDLTYPTHAIQRSTSARLASAQSVTPVPEPLTMLGSGAAVGIAGLIKRKRDCKASKRNSN